MLGLSGTLQNPQLILKSRPCVLSDREFQNNTDKKKRQVESPGVRWTSERESPKERSTCQGLNMKVTSTHDPKDATGSAARGGDGGR